MPRFFKRGAYGQNYFGNLFYCPKRQKIRHQILHRLAYMKEECEKPDIRQMTISRNPV
jgi:hypothetical protein